MAEHHKKLAACLRHEDVFGHSPYLAPQNSPQESKIDGGFPTGEWRSKIKSWAEGTNLSWTWSYPEEAAVVAANKALTSARLESRVDVRATRTTQVLEEQLKRAPAVAHASPDQARLQQSIIVLESLTAIGRKSGNAEDTLLAVAGLSPAAQRQLFMADEMTGNRLHQALHQAKTDYAARQPDGPDGKRGLPDLEKVYSDVRVESQVASALVRMNKRDPSGAEARLTAEFVDHLEKTGVSWEAQKAFANKLDFKSRVAHNHAEDGDLAPLSMIGNINGHTGNAEDRFTGQLFAALAETPGVGDEDLAAAMDMTEGSLLRLTAHSALRNREGDRRIVKMVSEAVQQDVEVERRPALGDLHNVLLEVSGGRYLPTKFAELASAGRTPSEMSAALGIEARERASKRSESAAKVMGDVFDKMAARRDFLKKEVIPKLRDEERAKAQNLHDDIDAFLTRFPKEQFTKERLLPVFEKFGENMKGPLDVFATNGMKPDDRQVNSMNLRPFMAFTQQVSGHQAALRDPRRYGEGLDRITPVLPTAGRDLRDCPWLGSTAADLAKTATLVKTRDGEYSLRKTPMIVFDQSDAKDKALWRKNDEYCRELETQYAPTGLKIVHVSMADVNRLAGPELRKMFDTTGQNYAGYGGARNMAYLLGPVIRQCENEGRDWRTLSPEEVLPLIQKHSLEKGPNKLFMGDDTDHVSEGTTLSKAVLAVEHQEEYTLLATMRDGRNTMVVSEGQTNDPTVLLSGGLDSFVSKLNGGNSWKPRSKVAGMGCTLSDARFCLDLPLGAEEKQHEAMKSVIDQFSKASHLASDRQKDFGEFFAGHLPYTNTSGMAKGLLREADLPWNHAHTASDKAVGRPKFDSLQSVMTYAADPAQVKKAQQNFFATMVEWRSEVPLASGALKLDLTPEQALPEANSKLESALLERDKAVRRLAEVTKTKVDAGSRATEDMENAVATARDDLEKKEKAVAFRREHKALLENAPPSVTTANGAVVDHFLRTHPELKPEDREQLGKVLQAYEKAGAEVKLSRQYMDKLLDELVPATRNPDTLPGSKLPKDELKRALETSLAGDPPDKAAVAIAKVKREMEGAGVDFNGNRLLRDMHLMTQSVGGGGFASLAQKLHTPAPKLEIGHAPEVVVSSGLAPRSEGVDVPRTPQVQTEPPREPTLGEEVFSFVPSSQGAETPRPDGREPIVISGLGLGEQLSEREMEARRIKEKEPMSTREALLQSGYKPRSPSTTSTGQRVSSTS